MRDRAANVASGRLAKFAGDFWEAFVEGQHAGAMAMGVLVHVQHNEPKAKYVGGRLMYVAKSGTDYTGLLFDGRALAVEAKTTKGRLSKKAVKKKQAEQLDAVVRVGGEAFLLVEFRDYMHKFAIPWLLVPWKKLRSAESIGSGDMKEEWRISPGECYLKRGVPMPAVGDRKRVFPRS